MMVISPALGGSRDTRGHESRSTRGNTYAFKVPLNSDYLIICIMCTRPLPTYFVKCMGQLFLSRELWSLASNYIPYIQTVIKTASKGLTHFSFLFSLFRNGKKRWAKVLSKCNMKALCDVSVCYIVEKVYYSCIIVLLNFAYG